MLFGVTVSFFPERNRRETNNIHEEERERREREKDDDDGEEGEKGERIKDKGLAARVKNVPGIKVKAKMKRNGGRETWPRFVF